MHRHYHPRPTPLTVAQLPVRPGRVAHCLRCGTTEPAVRPLWLRWYGDPRLPVACCGQPMELRDTRLRFGVRIAPGVICAL